MTVTVRIDGRFWDLSLPSRGVERMIVAEALRQMMTALEKADHPTKKIEGLVAKLEERGLLDVVRSGCDFPRITNLPDDYRPKKIEVGEVIYGAKSS